METWPYTTHHPLVSLAETVPMDMATFLHIPTNKKKKKAPGRVGPLLYINFMYITLQKRKK